VLLHRTEREKYYKHISITIDGMDQAKDNLPHFNIHTKVTKYFVAVELKNIHNANCNINLKD